MRNLFVRNLCCFSAGFLRSSAPGLKFKVFHFRQLLRLTIAIRLVLVIIRLRLLVIIRLRLLVI